MRILRLHIFWLIVLFILIVSGCFQLPDPDYTTRLKKIPAFFIDHFPNQLPNDRPSTFTTNTDTTNQCIYYFLMLYDLDSILKLDTSNLDQQALATYHAEDTNLITIKREAVTYWNPEKKKYYTDTIRDNKYYYPVPYFETKTLHFYEGDIKDIYSDETPSGLSKDFMLYVFDFNTGNFWQGLKPLNYLPEGWKNGYTKGVAINKSKKVVIHWFVVW